MRCRAGLRTSNVCARRDSAAIPYTCVRLARSLLGITIEDGCTLSHVHDNHGMKDEHLWPGDGTIDWKRICELLQTAPHFGAQRLVFEIEGDTEGNPDYGMTIAGKMLAAWKMLET